MNVQVHTYSKPKEWANHPLYASFPKAIHICATNNQRNGVKECYGHDLKHVYSFREFIKALYTTWYSAETKFQQYLRLSRIIANLQHIQLELKQAFRTNTMDVLDSIRFFVEANIKPHELRGDWLTTEKERVLKKYGRSLLKRIQQVKIIIRSYSDLFQRKCYKKSSVLYANIILN